MSRGGWIMTGLGLAAVAGFLAWATAQSFAMGSDRPFGFHGWLALALGLIFSALIGGGLMWLAFHSSRRGWDDLDREP